MSGSPVRWYAKLGDYHPNLYLPAEGIVVRLTTPHPGKGEEKKDRTGEDRWYQAQGLVVVLFQYQQVVVDLDSVVEHLRELVRLSKTKGKRVVMMAHLAWCRRMERVRAAMVEMDAHQASYRYRRVTQ